MTCNKCEHRPFCPVLVAQCERLRREVACSAGQLGQALLHELSATERALDDPATLRSVLSQCVGPKQRAERALELIVERARGTGGFLFLYHRAQDRLSLAAPLHGDHPPRAIEEASLQAIHKACENEEATTEVLSRSAVSQPTARASIELGGLSYRVIPLTALETSQTRVVGAVAVYNTGGSMPVAPRAQVLEALARSLAETGDVMRPSTRPPPAS